MTDSFYYEAAKALVKRYDKPGPRYTSYPTVPAWHDMKPRDLEQKLAITSTAPLSLYFHIPFCEQICHFCGCHTFQLSLQKQEATAIRYIDALISETKLMAEKIAGDRRVVQLHFGGGTPTFYPSKQLERLFQVIHQAFDIAPDAETAMELDPRVTSNEQVDLLKSWNFNRLSFGVQDFDPKVQKASNRLQSLEQTMALFNYCRQQDFNSINLDLIYGLPEQTETSFTKTVAEVLSWRPERLALFSYAHVPWMKAYQRKINEARLPDLESKFRIFLNSRKAFIDSGYQVIGMDHFALPEDELSIAQTQQALRRNFQGYTTKPESHVVAIGCSAIGDYGDLYVQNHKKFSRYYACIDKHMPATHRGYHLTLDDQIRRKLISAIMCNFCVDIVQLGKSFSIDGMEYFSASLATLDPFIDDGLMTKKDGAIRITSLGQLFVRNIAMHFDAHLQTSQQMSTQTFSRTI